MSVLHINWIMGTKISKGFFLLWEEDVEKQLINITGKRTTLHPFTADTKDLKFLIKTTNIQFKAVTATAGIYLPTLHGTPLTSDEGISEEIANLIGQKKQSITSKKPLASDQYLQLWQVAGLQLTPWQMAQLCLLSNLFDQQRLPDDEIDEYSLSLELISAKDILYWNKVLAIALEIVAQQLYLPSAPKNEVSNVDEIRWQPDFSHHFCQQRLELLAEMMPPVCRAVPMVDNTLPDAKKVLASVLNALVDDLVYQAIRKHQLVNTIRLSKFMSPGKVVLRSLTGKNRKIYHSSLSNSTNTVNIVRTCRLWSGRGSSMTLETNFNTCLRLVPPEIQGEQWHLDYYLQNQDQPALLLPAEEIWSDQTGGSNIVQNKLLADLGWVEHLFPPLAASLLSACPVGCKFSTREAYDFLNNAAPKIEESGITVQLPAFWLKRQQPKLKIKTKSPRASGEKSYFALNQLVEYDWELALGEQVISQQQFEQMTTLKQPLVQVQGQWVALNPSQIKKIINRFDKEYQQGLKLRDAVKLSLGVDEQFNEIEIQTDGAWRDFLDNLQMDKPKILIQPQKLTGTLRPYQLRGFSWLDFLTTAGFGACLADDMGLGKTIQLISLLLHRQQTGATGPSLLICPTSVLGNWQREIAKFAQSIPVLLHHGPARDEGEAFMQKVAKYQLVLTSYALVPRDLAYLNAVAWQGLILDEAQNIKNPHTKQTRSIRQLKAEFKVALTGTPVENRLSELWSISEFLNPGFLGNIKKFRTRFATPIEKHADKQALADLRRLVNPFILRRLKTEPEIAPDLPQKMELPVYCNLTSEQATLYEAVLREMMDKIANTDGIERKGLVLATITKLKQVCNHPALLLADGSKLPGRSGKLLRLTEMLEEITISGERVLIFTQYQTMGAMLCNYLATISDAEPFFIHGGVSRKERDKMVEQFQNDPTAPKCFLLTIKAGGVGINLTAATHVIHYDRWWNPAVENQATDRAYRIGQEKNVMVHKFICSGTIEERIDQMINSKKELAENVVSSGGNWITELNNDQLKAVFALRNATIGA